MIRLFLGSQISQVKLAITCVLFLSLKIQAQCTWSTLFYDGFEYSTSTVIPEFVPNLGYGPAHPDTYAHHSGSQSVYLNFVDSNSTNPIYPPPVHAGTLFYSKTFTVCPNVQYKVSSWFCTTFSGIACNLKIVVKDGSGVVLNSVNSFPCAYAPTFSQYTSGVLTPTTSTIILELTTNVGGGGGNDLGMDDLLVEQCLNSLNSSAAQTTLCSTSPPLDLYNLLSPAQPTYGTWGGPSTLNNGYLGTFNPSVNSSGQYIYTYNYQNNINCPLITDTANVAIINTPLLSVNTATICSGTETATLSATGALTYSWSPSTGLGSLTGPVVTSAPLSTTVYTIVGANGTCVSTITTTVTVGYYASISVNSATICSGSSAILSVSGGASTYTWFPPHDLSSTSGSTVAASPTVSTAYTVSGSLSGCISTATSQVIVNPSVSGSISASSLSVTALGDIVTLTASGGNSFNWFNDNSSASFIKVSPLQNTTYCVEVRENNQCPDTVCITIFSGFKSIMEFPNVFTPNGDGINDSFNFPSQNIIEYNLLIYNRWGLKVFESSDLSKGWDGTINGAKASDGVYSYIVNAKGIDNAIYEKAGHVTLFR